jgi:hypothetical protein
MKEVGKWVKAHGDAIYGTRAGDFAEKGKFTSTQKGNTTNLFIFDNTLNIITLEKSNRKLLRVKTEKGENVDFTQVDEKITLKLDKSNLDFVKVYKLIFK